MPTIDRSNNGPSWLVNQKSYAPIILSAAVGGTFAVVVSSLFSRPHLLNRIGQTISCTIQAASGAVSASVEIFGSNEVPMTLNSLGQFSVLEYEPKSFLIGTLTPSGTAVATDALPFDNTCAHIWARLASATINSNVTVRIA